MENVEIWFSKLSNIIASQRADITLTQLIHNAKDLNKIHKSNDPNVENKQATQVINRITELKKAQSLRITKKLTESLFKNTKLNTSESASVKAENRTGADTKSYKDEKNAIKSKSVDRDMSKVSNQPMSKSVWCKGSGEWQTVEHVGIPLVNEWNYIQSVASISKADLSDTGRPFFLLQGVLVTINPIARRHTPTLQLVIPQDMKHAVTLYMHTNNWFNHFGVSRTLARMKEKYYFSGMVETVRTIIANCELCQKNKRVHNSFHGIRKSLGKCGPWDTLGIDIFGPLPASQFGFKFIVVVIDQFTKWVELFAVKRIRSEDIANILLKLVYRFGCPRRILTDRGTQFTSQIIRDLCYRLGTRKVFTSAYRPQADGIAEAFMKVLGNQLAMLTNGRPKTWNRYLEQIEFAYRSTPHPSTGESPFYLLYGYDAQLPNFEAFRELEKNRYIGDMQKEAKERLEILQAAREDALEKLILLAQKQEFKYSKEDVSQIEYEIGQLILVKVSQVELQRSIAPKLQNKWTGPYRIVKQLSNRLTYEVESLADQKQKIVHVGNTRPFRSMQLDELDQDIVKQL